MLPEHVKKLIAEIAEEKCLQNWNFYLEPGSKKGDNFIGVIYRVILEGLNQKGETEKLSLIAKLAPEHEIRREKFQVVDCFAREAVVYQDILPEMTRLQKRIPVADRFISDVKCYKISTENCKECIVMEDITTKGYRIWDRTKPLNFESALLAMEQLGKFHGMSFVLRDQKPELFAEFQKLQDIIFSNEEYFDEVTAYFNIFLDKAINTLEDKEISARNKMKDFKNNFKRIMFDGVKGSLAEPYAVICHGDCWTNNMMFKYEKGRPVSLILLDWQIVRYSSPVTDIMYTIFCCTDKKLRDQHYDDLIKHYHNSLGDHVRSLGSDPEKLYPFHALQNHLRTFSTYSLGMSIYDLPNMIANADDLKDLDEIVENLDNENVEAFDSLTEKTEPIYRERMRDVILDCIKYDYL